MQMYKVMAQIKISSNQAIKDKGFINVHKLTNNKEGKRLVIKSNSEDNNVTKS